MKRLTRDVFPRKHIYGWFRGIVAMASFIAMLLIAPSHGWGATIGDAVDNTGLGWSTGGNANWYGQTVVSYSGGDAAQSGVITHSQATYVEAGVTGPGTLTFYWKVSSEASFDDLFFAIDTVEQDWISGEVGWSQRSFAIASGAHVVSWGYRKDSTMSAGSDAGWLDLVTFGAADTQPPTGSIAINGGAGSTNTKAVTLNLSASDNVGVTQMRFNNDAGAWSALEPYATTKAWTLGSTAGTRTVYVEYRDAAGNWTQTNDNICYDIVTPTGSITINAGAAYTNSVTVSLSLPASDSGCSGLSTMQFSDNGSTWGLYVSYVASMNLDLAPGNGTKYVYVRYWDYANNCSAAYFDTIVLDQTPPSGSITINGGASFTTTTAVTLSLSASDALSGMSQMRFSNDGSSWSSWETYGTSKSWTLVSGDGSKTVYVQYRDVAGNSGSYSDSICLDAAAPTGSVSINGGAAYTSSQAVTLTMSAADSGCGSVSLMRFSNDGSSWSAWESYSGSKSWTLTAGSGNKTVYVQFQDGVGNSSGSYSDGICYDNSAPTGSILVDGGAQYAASTSVTLTLTANDSGCGSMEMQISNDGVFDSEPWESYAASKAWTLPVGGGTKTVYARYRDGAGNTSGSCSDSITLDDVAPTGSVLVNGGAGGTSNATVTLSLSASDPLSGVSQMRFSNDGTSWSAWEVYGSSKSWTLSAGDGTKTCYVQYRDNVGNVSGSYSDAIDLDTTGPAGSVSIEGGAIYVTAQPVTLTLSATDALSAVSDMRFSNDGASWSSWEAYGTSKAWNLALPDGNKTVYVQFRDSLGNASVVTDDVVIDTVAPAGSMAVNANDKAVNTTAVTLNLAASDAGTGVADMRLSDDGSSWGAWEPYGTTKAWTLPAGDGSKTVYVQYRDVAGKISVPFSDGIILDGAPPTGSIAIALGAVYSTSVSVPLTLSAADGLSGVAQMQFSNDGVSWSALEPYSTTKTWDVAAGDGSKTVYVKYVDAAGNSVSATDDVILDATAPAGSIDIDAGSPITGAAAVALTLSASDVLSGISDMSFSNNGVAFGPWETYGISKAWTLSGGDGAKTVTVRFRDVSGNVAEFQDGILLDADPPSGSVAINGGAGYSAGSNVTLTLAAADAGTGTADMQFSDDGSAWSGWEAYGTVKPWTLVPGEGVRTVYVQYRDGIGHVSTVSDTITVATPAALTASSAAVPASVKQGQVVTVTMTVGNTGSTMARVTPSAAFSGGSLLIQRSGPLPAGPVDIPGGGSRTFAWTYEAIGVGTVNFTATAAGTDTAFGNAVNVSALSGDVSVTPAAVLRSVVHIPSGQMLTQDVFEIRLTVSNTGAIAAAGVVPSLTVPDPDSYEVIGGPVPAGPVTVPGGGEITFAWTLRALKAGQAQFAFSVSGSDSSDGTAVAAQAADTREIVKRHAEAVVAYPNPVRGDRLSVVLNLDVDAAEVEVEAYNTAYKRVFRGVWRHVPRGDGLVNLEGMREWAPGQYLLRASAVTAGGAKRKFPVVKVVVKR